MCGIPATSGYLRSHGTRNLTRPSDRSENNFGIFLKNARGLFYGPNQANDAAIRHASKGVAGDGAAAAVAANKIVVGIS